MLLFVLECFAGALGVAYVGFEIWWARKRRAAIRTTTIFHDIPYLAQSGLQKENKIQGTAVIAGGSLSGLLSAHILARYYSKVLIIEPEATISSSPTSRVGQRSQQHVISSLGLVVLRELFGGPENFDKRARELGAVIRTGWVRWTVGKYRFCSKPEDFPEMINISRVTLEKLVRDLVFEAAGSQITVVRGLVTDLVASPNGSSISSVQYSPLKDVELPASGSDVKLSPRQTIVSVESAIFLDCTGPVSLGAKLLPDVILTSEKSDSDTSKPTKPWGPYTSHQYDPHVSYRSATIHVSSPRMQDILSNTVPKGDIDWRKWDNMTVLDACQPSAETGKEFYAIQRLDGDRVLLFHCGWGLSSSELSASIDQYIENVHEIHSRAYGPDPSSPQRQATSWIFTFLDTMRNYVEKEGIEPEFVPFKMGPCKWIDFESGAIPNNFVALGDSRMRLNPPYGQGVKKLLLDITLLNRTLHEHFLSSPSKKTKTSANIATDFLQRVTPHTRSEHDGNRMADYAFPSTLPQEDEDPEVAGKEWREYWAVLTKLCSHDRMIARWTMWVLLGRAPALDLFHPYIHARVWLYRKFGV